jgi:hypothetical protein
LRKITVEPEAASSLSQSSIFLAFSLSSLAARELLVVYREQTVLH